MLPGALVTVLGLVGLDWPESDEDKIFELGKKWLELSGAAQQFAADTDNLMQVVSTGNVNDAIDAVQAYWKEHGAPAVMEPGAHAPFILGVGMFIFGIFVIVLKIIFVVQLVILAIQIAQAIATAVATFGASLLQIPIFRQLTRMALDLATDKVIEKVLFA